MRWLLLSACVIALGLAIPACLGEDRPCPTGSEGCACTAGGGCDPGLVCDGARRCTAPAGDGGGTPDGATGLECQSTSACWDSCTAHYTVCSGTCGVGDGVSCWERCDSHYTTCATNCGVETACAGVLCWQACTAHYTACASTCGISPVTCTACTPARSPRDMCWDACQAHQTTCAETCGT
jgi:hypothetical protein